MESKLTRKEQAQATKKKIFETSVKLIKDFGYDNVTVSHICREAGIAKGSFYVHYRSKEDIIRESYYSDMNEFISEAYSDYMTAHPSASAAEKIAAFLALELRFAQYTGHQLTCLAYSLNLSACVEGQSEHMQKRIFSKILFQLIQDAPAVSGYSHVETFTYLESLIRGIMATWCFSNGQQDMMVWGKNMVDRCVSNCFGGEPKED